MRLKCIAIDDEPLALQLISQYISRIPSLELAGTFENAITGAEFIEKHAVDLVFLDINMPDISGIDLVKAMNARPMVIFITAYKNFAFESYQLQAIDYLLKPIDFRRFETAVEKAIEYHSYKTSPKKVESDESLYVYSEYRIIKIMLEEIAYIESMEDYIKIHLDGQEKPVLTLMTMKKVLEKLPPAGFRRIHRSYIVAVNKVRSVHNRKVRIGQAELPVSDSYSDFIGTWSNKTV